LLPKELGNGFVSRLAVLSGYSSDHFGEFVEAKFTGHHLQNEDSTSKPDLIILTTKTKIFFEVKLKAPLSKDQLERHFNDVDKDNGYLTLISNIQSHVSEKLFTRKNYLKPTNQSHFFWSQFETVFNLRPRKGGLTAQLLKDFTKSLISNGIKGRQIIGTTENLYTNGSDAENLALNELKELLKEIGFKAWRKNSEFTLRVNLEKSGKNPLLNPRIYSSGEWLDDNCTKECLIVHCYANINEKNEINLLNELNILELSFPNLKLYDVISDKYIYNIYIPLQFIPEGTSYRIDWEYLKKVWEKIYTVMKTKLTN
jgi:hypothetical protein